MTYPEDKDVRDALRKPFPKEQIGQIPKGGAKLDYVGHAAVTDRLNQAAPDWTFTIDKLFDQGNETYVQGTMTIGGVSRPEFGDGKTPKEAVSNFIRRAAMRFGVGLDLWSKEELAESSAGGAKGSSPAVPQSEGVPGAAAYGEWAKASTPSDSSCTHPKRVATASGKARCLACGATMEPT